jgi:hypothetical protein
MITLTSEEQFRNVESRIHVTPDGITTLLSDEQSKNAEAPMLVTFWGIDI